MGRCPPHPCGMRDGGAPGDPGLVDQPGPGAAVRVAGVALPGGERGQDRGAGGLFTVLVTSFPGSRGPADALVSPAQRAGLGFHLPVRLYWRAMTFWGTSRRIKRNYQYLFPLDEIEAILNSSDVGAQYDTGSACGGRGMIGSLAGEPNPRLRPLRWSSAHRWRYTADEHQDLQLVDQ
jgi:hypothetical protein